MRLIETRVVFEFVQTVKGTRTIFGLIETRVVFEYQEADPIGKLRKKINRNKSCI